MQPKKLTIPDIRNRKNDTPIAELTAYDYPWAKVADTAGIDVILVGDSLGMVVLGYPDTVSVTMEEMIHHTKAVVRGVERALVVTDMPFGSYNSSIPAAIDNATRILKEGKADAVKLEGGVSMAPTVEAIVKAGIPVQGHIGLTPQTATSLGGFKVQGKNAQAAKQLLDDAIALEEAGCFSIVLEAIPAPLAKRITENISIPTIGIGAGVDCNGQVLVIHDLVGMYDRFTPKFVKQYTKINEPMLEALRQYKAEVENRSFPTEAHSFTMKSEELDKLLQLY
ncbi:3-methyl-2-oxobutanoate hydroxymethyltransferase [Desulfobulbus rhabdoformis]|uniref:3-methyl-2-oxobutanoate hydroxymethyltransferase n=1 Tax=Desulfobulbus rhabdoformis TaxID=34032 RepID=UPI001965805E|nr:3-methyl-2-oxobutanoate hydroxymethyltransferase [Desulfobulbus rhabdoformis]MBM9615556.1 3-methyl-2-oxobutanoate hydroxymethyltransferase [Desulfobulbus rhabdoformis]